MSEGTDNSKSKRLLRLSFEDARVVFGSTLIRFDVGV